MCVRLLANALESVTSLYFSDFFAAVTRFAAWIGSGRTASVAVLLRVLMLAEGYMAWGNG